MSDHRSICQMSGDSAPGAECRSLSVSVAAGPCTGMPAELGQPSRSRKWRKHPHESDRPILCRWRWTDLVHAERHGHRVNGGDWRDQSGDDSDRRIQILGVYTHVPSYVSLSALRPVRPGGSTVPRERPQERIRLHRDRIWRRGQRPCQ